MSVFAKVDTFGTTTDAATTTHTHSGYEFAPKLLLPTWCGRTDTTNAVGRADISRGMGGGISTSDRSMMGSASEDAVATSNSDSHTRITALMAGLQTSGASGGVVDIDSMDADGFTDIIDTQFGQDLTLQLLAIGGSEISVEQVLIAQPGSTGAVSYNTTNRPRAIIIMGAAEDDSVSPTIEATARYCIGIACDSNNTGTLKNIVMSGGSQNGAGTSDTGIYFYSGECLATLDSGITGITTRAALTDITDTSFELTWNEVSGSTRDYRAYVISGGIHDIQTDNLLTTASNIPITGLCFLPVGGLVLHGDIAALSTQNVLNDKDEATVGSFAWNPSGTLEQGLVGWRDQDAAGTTICSTAINFDNVAANMTSTVLDGAMEVLSRSFGNLTFNMTNANPSERPFAVWTFGSATAVMRRRREMVQWV